MMCEALALAEHAIGLSDPNPRVGCVITAGGDLPGRIIGRGHTQAAGAAHAEVMALRDVQANGEHTQGATAYVSLEPCSHHGRTPPCCDALIHAGIARVVVAVPDPNPLVCGQGLARMRAHGIDVIELPAGPAVTRARELNIGFFSRMQRGLPWVRLKVAMSLDGRTALNNGASQWITSEAARMDGHAWRKRAGAIVTGVGTVREDDPRLDVRLVDTARQPLRVVLDSRLETPLSARILLPPGDVLFYAAQPPAERLAALKARGTEVACLPNPAQQVDLLAMLKDLAQRGVNEVHVEAGQRLNGAFIQAGLVDELLVYMAPSLLGLGRDVARFGPMDSLTDCHRLHFHSVTPLGPDLRILARPL